MSVMSGSLADNRTSLKKLELALQQEVASGKNKKEADFKEAYPLLEQHLSNKGSQKVALEKFNAAYGYTLHPPRFRKLLDAERKRRAESGDVAVCPECGQPLVSATDVAETPDKQEDM